MAPGAKAPRQSAADLACTALQFKHRTAVLASKVVMMALAGELVVRSTARDIDRSELTIF